MESFVWKGHVTPGKLGEYTRKHREIWPEMERLMRCAGMRNYSIWNCGNDLIGYYEFLGMEKKTAVYKENQDILDRWNAHMGGIMEMDRDENGNVLNYSEIWLME